jgi:hypothetical protein
MWTSYPLTCFIECVWQQAQSASNSAKKDPLLVEICSVAERALNYMHTGNAAVIATSVMNPLWIGMSIIQDGLPCFNPKYVVTAHGNRIQVLPDVWPYNLKKHQPLCSSQRSQVLTYGESYFNVSDRLLSTFIIPCWSSGLLAARMPTFLVHVPRKKCAVRCISNGAFLCVMLHYSLIMDVYGT